MAFKLYKSLRNFISICCFLTACNLSQPQLFVPNMQAYYMRLGFYSVSAFQKNSVHLPKHLNINAMLLCVVTNNP